MFGAKKSSLCAEFIHFARYISKWQKTLYITLIFN
jgi:hypothetical protein